MIPSQSAQQNWRAEVSSSRATRVCLAGAAEREEPLLPLVDLELVEGLVSPNEPFSKNKNKL